MSEEPRTAKNLDCGEWPMESVPSSWIWAPFHEVFSNETSSSSKVSQKAYQSEGTLAVIDQGQTPIAGYINDESLRHPGPLPVIIFGDHTRCVKYVDTPFVQGADGVKVLRTRELVYPRYAYHALNTVQLPAKGYSRHFKFLSATSFPLPPLNEQRRIVAKLETLQSKSRKAREHLEAIPALLHTLRQSILAAAFRGDLTKSWREQNKDVEPASELLKRIRKERRRKWEEAELVRMKAKGKAPRDDAWKGKYQEPEPVDTAGLPELPSGWCWASVEELADVGTGATPNRGNERYWVNGTIPWVTSSATGLDMVMNASEFVTEAALRETNLSMFPPGTLLIAMYGEGKTRGKCSELAIAATTNQAVAALVTEGSAADLRQWLRFFMDYNYHNIRRYASGGVQPNLNLSLVRAIEIPIPPLKELQQACTKVETLLSVQQALKIDIDGQLETLTSLDRAILAKAFKGQLVPQDPNDEPALITLHKLKNPPLSLSSPSPKPKSKRSKS